MSRKESVAVPGGNGPSPQDAYEEEIQRVMSEMGEALKEIKEDLRSIDQRLTRLEHGARQPRLVMEADGQADTETRERTRAPLQQLKRCMGIAILPTGLIQIRCILPASVMTAPDRQHSLVQGRMPW